MGSGWVTVKSERGFRLINYYLRNRRQTSRIITPEGQTMDFGAGDDSYSRARAMFASLVSADIDDKGEQLTLF